MLILLTSSSTLILVLFLDYSTLKMTCGDLKPNLDLELVQTTETCTWNTKFCSKESNQENGPTF